MKTILWGLSIVLSARCSAQIVRSAAIPQLSYAAAYNQEFTDIFSSKINPASLSGISRFQASAWLEKKFMLEGLQQYSIITGSAAAGAGWAIMMDYAGVPSYYQWQSSLACGKKLGKLSLGIQMNYFGQSTAGYGNRGWLSAGLGTLWQLSPVLTAGMQLYNLTAGVFAGSARERPAYGYSAGLGFLAAAGILLEAGFVKNELQPASFLASLHYRPDNRIMASVFLDLTDTRPSVRIKWQTGILQIGVTGSYHAALGFSPGVLLIVSGNKKEGI